MSIIQQMNISATLSKRRQICQGKERGAVRARTAWLSAPARRNPILYTGVYFKQRSLARMDNPAPNTAHAPSLEEQIARLEALLEATRRVHASIASETVLLEAARILVRELEVEGALFLSPAAALLGSFGSVPVSPYADCSRFPLPAKDGALLAELLVCPVAARPLCTYETDFIEGLVLQTAVALENALLHERDLEWARVASDLDAARNIQRSLLPERMPAIAGFSIASRSDTCYEVGGDYLDVLPLPDGSQLFIVADVAGKGLASALVATSFRSAFRLLASQGLPLTEIAARVNTLHWGEGSEARRRYVTAILARLDAASGRVEIVNAGHNPGLLLRPDDSVAMVEASGTPLGLLPSVVYQTEGHEFAPGARLLLYTDGLTEVFCGEDEFGCERLTELFRSLPGNDAGAMLGAIWNRLEAFSAGEPATDDRTALAICHAGRLEERLHA